MKGTNKYGPQNIDISLEGGGGSGEGEGRGSGGGGEAISESAFWRIGINEFLVDNIKLVQP